jgi:serine/threonine protein kinase
MPSPWQTRKSNPAQRQPEPQVSAALERYDFGIKPVVLGRGASATVYKVTDKHLRRAVALKVFREEDAFTDNELTSLASLASLGGPNLVSFTDHGRIRVPGNDRLLPFIAMEYWQGSTLKDDASAHVSWENATPEDAGKWSEDTVEVIRQCFAGINQLHQGQVKHLDIKPSNIFITREPNGSVMAAKISTWTSARSCVFPTNAARRCTWHPNRLSVKTLRNRRDVFRWASSLTSCSPAAIRSPTGPRRLTSMHLSATSPPSFLPASLISTHTYRTPSHRRTKR